MMKRYNHQGDMFYIFPGIAPDWGISLTEDLRIDIKLDLSRLDERIFIKDVK
jgi:hypothetical protein